MSEAVPEQSESTERELSVAELRRLIFLSYKFSQGNAEVGRFLMQWAYQYYGPKDPDRYDAAYIEFTDKLFTENVYGETTPRLELGEVHKPGLITKTAAETERLPLSPDSKNQLNYPRLVASLWAANHKHVTKGRERGDAEIIPNTLSDPYYSLVVNHIIRKQSTGDAAFDALFADINTCPLQPRAFAAMIETYNEHHPETPVTEDEIARLTFQPSYLVAHIT